MKVAGHGGIALCGLNERMIACEEPDVIRLDELHFSHHLGVVVAAEGAGTLPADEAAGGLRVDAVGVFDQIADEVIPVADR